MVLSATPNVITLNVISSEYFMKFLFRSVYALSQFGIQIIESVILFSISASATPVNEMKIINSFCWKP